MWATVLGAWLETPLKDVGFAWRSFRRAPGVALVIILSLALGLGATITAFCWVRNLLWHPLRGVPAQNELVLLRSSRGGGNISRPDAEDFDRLAPVFAGVSVSQTARACLTVDRNPEWIDTQVVSANYFRVLQVPPLAGRLFLPDEDKKPGGNSVLVISERLWRRRFGGDPAVIGRDVELNRHHFTVIGVAPGSFRGSLVAASFEAWAPLSMVWEVRNQTNMEARNARGWQSLARLSRGTSVAQAQAAVLALDAQLARDFPDTNREVHHRVETLAQDLGRVRPMLWLLLAVSAGVLLIVMANVTNLLLARAVGRQKELALRLAAGAGRGRILRQLLTESLLLALPGGWAGLELGRWAVNQIPRLLPATLADRVFLEFELDPITLGFALALTVGTGLLVGLLPALQAGRTDPAAALRAGGRSASSGRSHHRARGALVVAEISLAVVLLIAAGLLVQGLERARRIDLGLDPDRVLIAGLQIGMNGYTPETGLSFYRQLRERLAELPGVERVALASWLPLGSQGCKGSGVRVEGYQRPPGEDTTYEYAIVSPGYFDTLRVPLLEGRDFSDADDAQAEPVAIVNEHFARRFWPGRSPIGRRFFSGGRWRTVVGLAKAGKYNRLDEGPWCFYYLPEQQGVPDLDLGLCVRTSADPAAMASALRQAVHELDPQVDLMRVFRMDEHTDAALFAERLTSRLLSMLALVALALAAIGVYAVVAYSVGERTQEFGVRLAVGADRHHLAFSVIVKGLRLAAVGAALGLALAASVTHLLAGFLFGVSAFDAVTFFGVPLFLTGITAIACWLPAWRAGRVDPIAALRCE